MARPLTPDVVADICAHMNEDHADAVAHYARTFAACPDAAGARLARLDAAGMELRIVTSEGERVAHVAFDHELLDADDARLTLIAMARRAAPGA